MENLNFGIAKAVVSNKITSEFINESKLEANKGLAKKFVETIKSSSILMKEYTMYNNIENKHTTNDIIASKFIDANLSRFRKYPSSQIRETHELLKEFVDEKSIKNISESKVNLYNAIGILLIESNDPNGDINKIDVAYESVLNYIKENKKQEETESTIELNENINIDNVVEVATKKYNETFSSLDESEIELIKKLVYASKDEKQELFESLKNENIQSLEALESNGVADKINEAIDKLKKMTFSEDTLAKNVVELINLKESLN